MVYSWLGTLESIIRHPLDLIELALLLLRAFGSPLRLRSGRGFSCAQEPSTPLFLVSFLRSTGAKTTNRRAERAIGDGCIIVSELILLTGSYQV